MTNEALDRVAVDLQTAARIADISPRRLVAWDSRGFLSPDTKRRISTRNTVRLYDFGELVEIKVALTLLDQRISLPHIQRLIQYLREVRGVDRPLERLAFAVVRGRIYFKLEDGNWEGEDRPGQIVIHQVLDLEAIRAEMRAALKRDRQRRRRPGIEQRRRVRGGKPVFTGTRTPVAAVLAYVDRGYSDKDILAAYPHLTPEDIALARRELASA